MNSAAVVPMALILVPACVVIGWMLRCMAGRRGGRHPVPRPLWTPEFDELEPVREPRWEESERYYKRPQYRELPQHTTINNHFYGAVPGWPAQPRLVVHDPTNRELLP